MDIEQYIQPIIDYVGASGVAAPIVFALCFADRWLHIAVDPGWRRWSASAR
jgi:hypothetical protein